MAKIAAFRDVLIHEYMKLDLDEIWRVIKEDLPGLKEQITQILAESGTEA